MSDRGSAAGEMPGRLLEAFVAAKDAASSASKVGQSGAGKAILEASEATRTSVLVLVLLELTWVKGWTMAEARHALASRLLKDLTPVSDESMIGILNELPNAFNVTDYIPIKPLVDWIEAAYKSGTVSAELDNAVDDFRNDLGRMPALTKALRKQLIRLGVILGRISAEEHYIRGPVDSWTSTYFKVRDELDPASQEKLQAIVELAASARGSKPTKTYLKKAKALTDEFSAFEASLRSIIESIGVAGARSVKYKGFETDNASLLDSDHTDLLRGILWMCADTPELALPLGGAAERCYKKIPGIGPRCAKTGTACVNALSRMGSVDAMGQLSRLQTVVKHASTRKQLEKALAASAEAAGVTRAQLEEMAVPDGGLSGIGRLEQAIGAFTGVLTVESATGTKISWLKADGSPQKSVPAAVKSDQAAELRAFKKTAKDLKGLLLGQRHRLERLFLEDRPIPLADWRKFYVDHPLVGFFARRLIWRIGKRLLAFADPQTDQLVTVDDEPVALHMNTAAEIRLWHPVDSEAAEVGAWREWLFRHEVTQPLKQAFREVYLLTPAELDTGRYSNRFAAHLLKQHQFKALCDVRGWRYSLQGQWDSDNTPTITLPDQAIRAEFWVEGVDAEAGDTGVFLYVATDQVRFYQNDEREPMALDAVPPRLFTELMRDVDLFVGVCSVGNDPEWHDQGLDTHRDYWHRSSFGDLNASATSRRAVLQGLIPRLKIADRCSLGEKFLIVRGDIRTYKIHLGSGNILMEPNDQYLCIVASRGQDAKTKNLFLPFEGDRTLAIILSKAFLLAADKKIKDRTILAQIRP